MTTRLDLRNRIRKELGDEAIPYLWSDDLLNLYIGNAVNRLSRQLSREGTGEITPVVGQKDYPLPSSVLLVTRVEYPTGEFPPRDPSVVGEVSGFGFDTGEDYQAWEVYQGRLLLRLAPTAVEPPLLYRCRERYTVPATDGSALDVPDDYEMLIVYLTCAEAIRWWEKQQGKRSEAVRQATRPTVSIHAGQAYESAYRETVKAIKGRAVRSGRLSV